jgi:hypothetical protein
VANVCFPGYQSGRHIAWDTGKLSILAFELQAANGGDHGDISIGVAHPDNLQVRSSLVHSRLNEKYESYRTAAIKAACMHIVQAALRR